MERGLLFAGGGTGGHVYMAVAVIQRLRELGSSPEILFVGTRRGLENRILPDLDVKLERMTLGGLNRTGFLKAFQTLLQLPAALLRAGGILRRFRPAAVVGLGGYSSGPVVLVASWMRIPCLVIEPNVHPGLANRLLAPWVDRVAVAFEETAGRFGRKARLTGIPVRPQFHRDRNPPNPGGPLRVLIFGGSQGSVAINRLVCQALEELSPERIRLIHQTGPRHRGQVEERYRKLGVFGAVLEYIHDMPERLHWADLVICRAGALTLAEVTAAGKASILIPYPYAADDHQRTNAQALVRRGAALILEEGEEAGPALARLIRDLDRDRLQLGALAAASGALGDPRSCDRIIGVLGDLMKEHRRGAPCGRPLASQKSQRGSKATGTGNEE